ncbi:MAG: hypothetical protein ACR2RL_07895 [Gammaproteobacteria bacterium]
MSERENELEPHARPPAEEDGDVLTLLEERVLSRRTSFPAALESALRTELAAALEQARGSEPVTMTVMNPVSRPMTLKLGVLVTDTDLDTMYAQDWAELAVSDTGSLYLVYRLRNGGDYAVEWTPATTLPSTMMQRLTPALAAALLESDD